MQLILIVFSIIPTFAQDDSIANPYEVSDTLPDNFGLFTNDELLNLSLRFDLTNYRRKKPKEEYMKAILTYHINEKDSVNKEIRLKSRGEFRNGFCDFPPIRVNFKKADFQKEDIRKIEKMKLVTHCTSGNEENLLKEYLIYKLYNLLTDYSFRVRLVKINYIDTYKKRKPIIAYAFFIEPIEFLAERMNCIEVKSASLSQKNIIPEALDRMAIFNYMIGNADWSVPNQHNCKVFSIPTSDRPELGMIVPYDFDYTGMVDASYAIPSEVLGTKSIKDRVYFGMCRPKEVFLNDIKEFSDKKEEFYKVVNEFPYSDKNSKKEMIRYLDEFYNEFDEKNSIIDNFIRDCKEL